MNKAGNERTDEDELDLVFGRANPNPDRIGCPTRAVLIELAGKQRPIDDPAYHHLAVCSPCYVEVRALQQAAATTAGKFLTGTRLRAAAVVLLTIGGGGWFFGVARDSQVDHQGASDRVRVALDLRGASMERGDGGAAPGAVTVVLPARSLSATIFLPVASEPGPYDVQLADSSGTVRTSVTGAAVVRDYVTTLQVDLGLSGLVPGRYQLGVRHQGEDWRLFAATLQ